MNTPDTIRSLLLPLLLALPVSLLVAQDAPPPPAPSTTPAGEVFELDPFEVKVSGDVGYHSTHAAEATRFNMALDSIPMAIMILNQEFLEDTMARSTEDVLEYVPGFIPESNNDNWVIRGFANANTKFMNGFLQQESIGKVSVANVERVEVLRGPAAVLFGSGGYAATVNRVTKRPLPKAHTHLRASYGPLDSVRFEFDHGGPIPKTGLSYRITGVVDDGEYYRRISHDERAIGSSLLWSISPRTRIIFEQVYVKEEDGGAVWRQPMMRGDPYGFTLPNGDYLSYGDNRQGYASPHDYRTWIRTFQMVDLQHAFNRHVVLRMQFARDTKDQQYFETQPEQGSLTLLKDAVLMPRSWRDRYQDIENLRSRNELIGFFDTGPATHRLIAGFSWDQSDEDVIFQTSAVNRGGLSPNSALLNQRWPTSNNVGSRFNVYPNLTYAEFLADVRRAGFNPHMIPPLNVIQPELSPPVEALVENRPPLRTTRNSNDVSINREFYVSDMMSFSQDRFFVTGGMRRTRTFNRRFDNITQTNASEGIAYATTYSAGTVYHLKKNRSLTLYANANSSFIPEFRRQPDGSALPPEEGNQKEVGLRFSARDNTIQGMLSLYEIQQENVAEFDSDLDEYIMTDRIRSRGVEFSLNGELTKSLRVYGGYAYTDARDTATNARVYAVPYHHFTAFTRYSLNLGQRRSMDFMLGSIYIGSRPIMPDIINSLGGAANAPDWTMPGVWRFDTMMRYRFRPTRNGPRYELRCKIQNLLDNQEIFKRADRVSFQLQPGRTIEFDFRVRF